MAGRALASGLEGWVGTLRDHWASQILPLVHQVRIYSPRSERAFVISAEDGERVAQELEQLGSRFPQGRDLARRLRSGLLDDIVDGEPHALGRALDHVRNELGGMTDVAMVGSRSDLYALWGSLRTPKLRLRVEDVLSGQPLFEMTGHSGRYDVGDSLVWRPGERLEVIDVRGMTLRCHASRERA